MNATLLVVAYLCGVLVSLATLWFLHSRNRLLKLEPLDLFFTVIVLPLLASVFGLLLIGAK